MTIGEALQKIGQLRTEIKNKRLYLLALKNRAERVASTITDMPPAATRQVHGRELVLADIIDTKKELAGKEQELYELESSLITTIRELDDDRLKAVMTERFLMNRTCRETSTVLHLGERYIKKLCSKAKGLNLATPVHPCSP